jgi:hypothetical protein
VSTSFTNPDREEPDATSPVTDGPVQDSQSVEDRRGVPEREDVLGSEEPEVDDD